MKLSKWLRGAVCALLSILIFQCGMLSALADASKTAAIADDTEKAAEVSENAENSVEEKEVKVPILLYHNIIESGEGDIANISAKVFETHILALDKAGYKVISLNDYISYVNGKKNLPEKPVIITFDDGYSSNYEIAFPILKRYRIPATIFVVAGTVGERAEGGKVNNPHFTWEQAAEMHASGLIDIESHTLSHSDLSKLNIADVQRELRMSKYMIEKNLKKSCDIIAFPYGGYDRTLVPLAESAGYTTEVLVDDKLSSDPSYANKKSDGLHSIKRLTISGSTTSAQLLQMIKNTVGE